METVVIGRADVWVVPLGSSSLSAVGCTRVEVSMKNSRSRKTISDIPALLKLILTLFFEVIAIGCYFTGSLRISRNSVEVVSSWKTTFSTLTTRVLYPK